MKKSKHEVALPRPRYEIAMDDFEYDEDNFELPDFMDMIMKRCMICSANGQ